MEALHSLGNITHATCDVISRNVTVKNTTVTVSSFSPLLCGLYGMYPSWRPVVIIILVGFILMSVLGNGCLVAVIATRESMQEPGNYFLAALAATDMFSSLLYVPISIHNTAHGAFTNGGLCKVQTFFGAVAVVLSHSLLMCQWVCRYTHITCPMQYEKKLARSRIVIAMAACVLIAVLPPFVGVVRTGTVGVVTYQGATDMEVSPTTIYPCLPGDAEGSITGTLCLVMMIISSIFAILIYRVAQKHKENLKDLSPNPGHDVLESKLKAAKTLGIVLLVYWMTWFPSLVLYFLSKVEAMSTLSVALDVFQIVVLTNTFVDAMVYAFRYAIYREASIRMFRDVKNAIGDVILDYIEIIAE
ncbi:trace amine-associated receptor 13c-like [Branchiostoma lanceolatum]|uniref:trace amine-associated receptor 13c-like n=1 Tax=Branchiostoma lanceolatum TaxID=7740 RepID=UPI00345217C8